jgi:hypothetical protein
LQPSHSVIRTKSTIVPKATFHFGPFWSVTMPRGWLRHHCSYSSRSLFCGSCYQVRRVTIDRPEQANALDPPTLRQLAAAWRQMAADPDIRGVGRGRPTQFQFQGRTPIAREVTGADTWDRNLNRALLAGYNGGGIVGSPHALAIVN